MGDFDFLQLFHERLQSTQTDGRNHCKLVITQNHWIWKSCWICWNSLVVHLWFFHSCAFGILRQASPRSTWNLGTQTFGTCRHCLLSQFHLCLTRSQAKWVQRKLPFMFFTMWSKKTDCICHFGCSFVAEFDFCWNGGFPPPPQAGSRSHHLCQIERHLRWPDWPGCLGCSGVGGQSFRSWFFIWMFPKIGVGFYPPNHPFVHRILEPLFINHPFWGKTPYFWKHPNEHTVDFKTQRKNVASWYTPTEAIKRPRNEEFTACTMFGVSLAI